MQCMRCMLGTFKRLTERSANVLYMQVVHQAYLLEQSVSIMSFIFLALPLISQGLNISQSGEPSKQVGVRRTPSTCKLDAVQLKVPSPSKSFSEQLL